MPSPLCERAISDAHRFGKALLKSIAPNDIGLGGGHQKGYYLPKAAAHLYSPHKPKKGMNYDHPVKVIWQDGRETDSMVKWYGSGTRSEYRLTRFGREFPFLQEDSVGNLLVLIPETLNKFYIYVFDLEDDIEDIQAALGAQIVRSWALYDEKSPFAGETEDACLDRHFRHFAGELKTFPPTVNFAKEARQALIDCIKNFLSSPLDDRLLECVRAEYRLFRLVERKICEPQIVRVFKSVDDFLATAQSILQRRKSRAGKSLEHHVENLLEDAGIRFEPHSTVDGTEPDILIPGKREYMNPSWPDEKLFVVGIKTTCKDRWRQVTKEAPRIQKKHILTLQQGISSKQIDEMKRSKVRLVVPRELHREYPPSQRGDILSVESFFALVKTKLDL